MVEIVCPYCEEEIELPDDAYGEFECPHCSEIFEWEKPGYDFEEMEKVPLRLKAGAIGFCVVIFFMIVAIGAIGELGQVNTDTWVPRQGEIIDISYEGRQGLAEEKQWHGVSLTVSYDGIERQDTLKCDYERDERAYVENNPIGTVIDIRKNPDESQTFEYGHFVVEGGCPMPPLSTSEIVGGVVCFSLILTIIGIETIRDKIRNR